MPGTQTYNLFRRALEPDILCAVPENLPVPSFIVMPGWEYQGRISKSQGAGHGFNTRAVDEAVRFKGFYILHRLRKSA